MSLYGCTGSTASDTDSDTHEPAESSVTTTSDTDAPTESSDTESFDTESFDTELYVPVSEDFADLMEAVSGAKNFGEAIAVIYPELSFDADNVVEIFFNSEEYDEKYASISDKATVSSVIDTIKDAPLTDFRVPGSDELAVGMQPNVKFYGENNELLLTCFFEGWLCCPE